MNIQRFGGRGASSTPTKNSGRAMLQERINKTTTRLYGDERVMVIKNDKVVFSTRLREINSPRFSEELNKPAGKVVYRKEARTFMVYQEEKRKNRRK